MKKLALVLLFVFLSVAQETQHTVKPGDTLWDIAGFYYQNPFLWPYIWRANLTAIEDPHWIYPDEIFVIPASPEESVGTVPRVVAPVVEVPEVYIPPTLTKPSAEVISVVEAEKRIWSEALMHRAGFIVKEDLPFWSKVIATEPRGDKVITTYDRIYIDRAVDVVVGQQLTVYRPGKGLSSPKTGEDLGREIVNLGKLEVQEVGEDGSRCRVIASYDIIRPGDLVMPYEPILAPIAGELTATTRELEAYIVDVRSFAVEITPPHIFVFIDRGEESDVAPGDIFLVYNERVIAGKKMPDFNIGKVEIISVFEKASIGLLREELETVKIRRGEHCRLAMESR